MTNKIFNEFEYLVSGYSHLGSRRKSNKIIQLWFNTNHYNHDYRGMILTYLRNLGLKPINYKINLWNDKFVVYGISDITVELAQRLNLALRLVVLSY